MVMHDCLFLLVYAALCLALMNVECVWGKKHSASMRKRRMKCEEDDALMFCCFPQIIVIAVALKRVPEEAHWGNWGEWHGGQ